MSRDRYEAEGLWSPSETLQSRVRETARRDGERVAGVDDEGRVLSYGRLDMDADDLAAGLQALGLETGAVIGMQMPNRVEALTVMCAIERVGGIVCPLMPMYRLRELEHIARAGRMRAMIVAGTVRKVDHDALAADLVSRGLIDHAVSMSGSARHRHVHPVAEVVAMGRSARPGTEARALDPNADAALMFTSGTTGSPKGVLHTHNTLLAGNRALSRALALDERDVIFIPAVVGHGTGYVWGMRFALFLGARAVLVERWHPETGARLVAAQRCTWTMIAPTFVQDLLDSSERAHVDLGAVRYVSCGGAAPPTSLYERLARAFDCQLLRLYGQTEAFLSTHCMPGDPIAKLAATEGRALPGVELRVVRDDGTPADDDEIGELHARGAHRCVGLIEGDVLRRVGADEWIPSGDLASIDAEGFLSIRGRRKEFINRGGFKYSPVEVEDLLLRHPEVARVAVVAVPDERLGERGCACIIPKADRAPTLESVVSFLRNSGMAPFKWPERIEVFDEFPLTPSGKVKKYVLRELIR